MAQRVMVEWRKATGNYRTVIERSVADLFDEDDDSYYLSYRPLAGTTEVPRADVILIQPVSRDCKIRLPRKVKVI